MVRLTGRQASNYQGVQASSPPNFMSYNRVPTPTDWQNFYLGDLWLVNNKIIAQDQFVYILVSLRNNIANWVRFAGGNGDLTSLTSNDTVTVFGDAAQNVNVYGDTTTIIGVGNAGTHTITLSVVGGRAASSFVSSAPVATPTVIGGTATALLGVINVQGSHNISVSAGTPNTGAINNIVYWLNNAIILGDLAAIAANANAITCNTGNIQLLSGNIVLPATTSASVGSLYIDGSRFAHAFGATTDNNTFIGQSSGNYTLTTGTAVNNTGVGYQSLNALTTGSNNTGLGYRALSFITTGTLNTSIGNSSGIQLTTGSANTLLGLSAGQNYTSSESSNILIGYGVVGTISESNTARIGVATGATLGELNRFFTAGVRGITTDAGDGIPVIISSTGQLGTGDGYFATGAITPTLSFGGAAVGIVYALQSGEYTKIGNIVFFTLSITISSKGSSTGNASIFGLPYTCSNSVFPQDANMQAGNGLTCSGGATAVWGNIISNTTRIDINQGSLSGGARSIMQDTNFANLTAITLNGFYFTS